MNQTSPLDAFLKAPGIYFDVRSPQEYAHAHIPGAINLPLFSDEERAAVGTVYKQQGQKEAIRLGVKLVGPKLANLMLEAESHIDKDSPFKTYCWRGGMRSGFVSFFLRFLGYNVLQLEGGYKTFRRAILNSFLLPFRFFVIGGLTGCGKTEILHELNLLDQQTVDLEGIACHRGSAYGTVEGLAQPSNEQFENQLGMALLKRDSSFPIWIEDESRLVGQCVIPKDIFHGMQCAPLFIVSCPIEERVERICRLYGQYSKEQLIMATSRIGKKLGGAVTREVIAKIEAGLLEDAVRNLLYYYDSAYELSMNKHRGPIIRLPMYSYSSKDWAKLLIERMSDGNECTTAM